MEEPSSSATPQTSQVVQQESEVEIDLERPAMNCSSSDGMGQRCERRDKLMRESGGCCHTQPKRGVTFFFFRSYTHSSAFHAVPSLTRWMSIDSG
jgi:hypothetical protein